MKTMIGIGLALWLPVAAWAQFGQQNSVTFEMLDVDGNMKIDREEAREESRLNLSFTMYDLDGDGTISKREYARFLGPRSSPRLPL